MGIYNLINLTIYTFGDTFIASSLNEEKNMKVFLCRVIAILLLPVIVSMFLVCVATTILPRYLNILFMPFSYIFSPILGWYYGFTETKCHKT